VPVYQVLGPKRRGEEDVDGDRNLGFDKAEAATPL
jgi:hypothetical protein